MSDQNLPHRLHSDRPLRNVSTLKPWHESRIDGAVIINRLSRAGMFDVMSAGAFKIVTSMANIFGVKVEHGKGLMVRKKDLEKEVALRIRLSRAVGLGEQSNYTPIRELLKLKIIERIPTPEGDDFVLIMPDEPISGSPENEDDEPLQDCQPDNPAMQDARATTVHYPNSALQDYQPDNPTMQDARASGDLNFVKSDSSGQNSAARASYNAPSIAIATKLKDIKALRLRGGWSVARILIERGGMGGPRAGALAKNPNATLEQIAGAIVLCDIEEATKGLRYPGQSGREAFITSCVKKKWDVPLEQDLLLEGHPEHEAESEAAIYAEISKNAPAGERGNLPATLPPPVEAPVINSRTLDLLTSLPDAERDAAATRQAAELVRRKMMNVGQREAETFTAIKQKLAAIGPDKLDCLVDAAIAAATAEFIAEKYRINRAAPLEYQPLMLAIFQIYSGGQL